MAEDFRLFTSLRYDPALTSVKDVVGVDVGWNSQRRSAFYMLDYHRTRMLRAATHWGWADAQRAIAGEEGLEKLESFLQHAVGGSAPLRVKVLLSKEGLLSVETSPAAETPLANLFPARLPAPSAAREGGPEEGARVPRRQPVWQVHIDSEPTRPSDTTHYKTTRRAMYDEARRRASLKLTDASEVLMVNESGSVMEGSTTTPYFWRNGRWVTPPVLPQYSPQGDSGGQDGTTRRWALERFAVEEDVKADSVVEGEEVWISNGVRGFISGTITKSPK